MLAAAPAVTAGAAARWAQLAACQVKVKLPDELMLPGVTRVCPLRTRSIDVVLSEASDLPLTVLLLIETALNFGTASDSGPAASKITSALLSSALVEVSFLVTVQPSVLSLR